MNLPNKISLTRICLIPVFIAVFFITAIPFHYGIAAIIFAVAALTDFVDGKIARKYGLVTNLGKFLDSIADKVLISIAMMLLLTLKEDLFAKMGVSTDALYIGMVVCVCIILARELLISAFRQIAAANGVIMAAEKLGKYKTACQDVATFVLILAADLFVYANQTAGVVVTWIGLALFVAATVLTIVSGISYVVKNKQVLKDSDK
ncbi:MAG: CDP-diacylglycerol--glycerol-3-phosphate 3-phosphatidyltransferase [Clostridiales bacterium]|nr:CDP-diacylglycerol--glycerol-3-phosphate 3-phosphatidyltransferase [Clostridiales bacterium]